MTHQFYMYPTNFEPELEEGSCLSIPCVSNTTFVSLMKTVLKYRNEIDSMNAGKVAYLESTVRVIVNFTWTCYHNEEVTNFVSQMKLTKVPLIRRKNLIK